MFVLSLLLFFSSHLCFFSGDDDDLDVNVCPPGVDKSVYVRLMNLREMQANNSDILGETKKLFDQQVRHKEEMWKNICIFYRATLEIVVGFSPFNYYYLSIA